MAEKEIKAKRSNRQKTLDMVYIAIFAVIIAVCSWISVPMVVPFTLQTFGVFCPVGLLGGKRGTLSVLIYVLLGAVGVPVFAGFSSGIGTLLRLLLRPSPSRPAAGLRGTASQGC